MHAVGPADAGSVLKLHGAAAQHLDKANHAAANEIVRLSQGERLGRIDDIGAGEPEVQPAGSVAAGGRDGIRHRGGERDDVMAGFGLDLVDAGKIETGVCGQIFGRLPRDEAGVGQDRGGRELYTQPVAEAILF